MFWLATGENVPVKFISQGVLVAHTTIVESILLH